MTDLGGASLFAVILSILVIVMTASLVAEHTSARVLRLPEQATRAPAPGHRSLIVEVPWMTPVLGGGELFFVFALLHPNTTLTIRIVSAAQLVAMGLWVVHVAKAIRKARQNQR